MDEKKKAYKTDIYNVGHRRQPIALESSLDGQAAQSSNPRSSQRVRRCHHFTVLSILLWCAFYTLLYPTRMHGSPKDGLPNESFNWTSIKPSKKLQWHACFKDFECARLEVPFDYSNLDARSETAAVAILRSPSVYSEGDDRYLGPILFNPGGPGGSGTALIELISPELRMLLGDGYDLVGFDPRGTGFTTPPLSIFLSQVDAGAYFSGVSLNVNTTSESLGDLYAKTTLLGDMAKRRSRHVAEYVSTPTVAHDMLSIVKAHGREKLQYWGFSYGTVLGATFAAMFPDKIERLVIDGVVDAEDYYSGQWSNNLRDTDKVLFGLYDACVAAGPKLCAMYEESPDLIHERVTSTLDSLKTNPIPYYNPDDNAYSVIDYGTAKYAFFITLYSPYMLGSYAMQMLALLEKGDPSLVWMFSFRRVAESLIKCDCSGDNSNYLGSFLLEPMAAIACGDGKPVAGGYKGLKRFYEKLGETSIFGEVWPVRGFCAGWKVPTKAAFKGHFKQNTSHPILLIGNTADTVTPLWNAHKMSKGFNNSVVLTQDSLGHCSISAVSLCTVRAVRDYFRHGTLPEKGKVCDVQSTIFGDGNELKAYEEALTEDDRVLFRAAKGLHQKAGLRRTLL